MSLIATSLETLSTPKTLKLQLEQTKDIVLTVFIVKYLSIIYSHIRLIR